MLRNEIGYGEKKMMFLKGGRCKNRQGYNMEINTDIDTNS